jgi:hypothetical protein
VRIGPAVLRVILDPYLQIAESDTIRLEFPPDHCVVIPRSDDAMAELRTVAPSGAAKPAARRGAATPAAAK